MKAQTVLDMPPETLEGVLAKVGDALCLFDPDLSTVKLHGPRSTWAPGFA